jgi:hypothetical protein
MTDELSRLCSIFQIFFKSFQTFSNPAVYSNLNTWIQIINVPSTYSLP